MNKEYYITQIEKSEFDGADRDKVLSQLKAFVNDDEELSDDEKLELEDTITSCISEESETEGSEEDTKQTHRRKRVFPVYRFTESCDLPDIYDCLNPDSLPYPQWLECVFFPSFVVMPKPELQNKIATVLALINCKAVLNSRMKLPIPYCLGRRGSGKSEFGYSVASQYLEGSYVEIRTADTGASIRNSLDAINLSGEPTLALFDNFNPTDGYSLERMGPHYATILANCEEQSISRIVESQKEQRKGTYKTYSYKIFNSVYPLSSVDREEAKEIARRTITLSFEKSEPKERRSAYDYQGMKDGYLALWSDSEKVMKEYGPLLAKLARMKNVKGFSDPSTWEILVVPLAVGVFSGVLTSIDEGIEIFSEQFKWIEGQESKHNHSKINMILTQFINERKSIADEANANPFKSDLADQVAFTRIKEKDLKGYISRVSGQNIPRHWEPEIAFFMADNGYSPKLKGEEIYYILEQ